MVVPFDDTGFQSDNPAPGRKSLLYLSVEKVIKEQVFQVRVLPVCLRDLLQEDGTDDTPLTPDAGNRPVIQIPTIMLGSVAKQGESLCIGNQLGCV